MSNESIGILIVEDNRTNRMLMEMLVGQIPNCVVTSYSAPADVLRDLPSISFDLGIVDYQMPGINGIELIEHIRSDRRFADTPFVMVTASRYVPAATWTVSPEPARSIACWIVRHFWSTPPQVDESMPPGLT